MTIQVIWAAESKTLIRVVFDGPYTWEEYDAVTDQIVMMMNSVSHQVDVMILLDANVAPPTKNSMPHFRRTQDLMPPNLGLLITVGKANLLTRLLFSTLITMRKIKVNSRVVNTEEEALLLIQKNRSPQYAEYRLNN